MSTPITLLKLLVAIQKNVLVNAKNRIAGIYLVNAVVYFFMIVLPVILILYSGNEQKFFPSDSLFAIYFLLLGASTIYFSFIYSIPIDFQKVRSQFLLLPATPFQVSLVFLLYYILNPFHLFNLLLFEIFIFRMDISTIHYAFWLLHGYLLLWLLVFVNVSIFLIIWLFFIPIGAARGRLIFHIIKWMGAGLFFVLLIYIQQQFSVMSEKNGVAFLTQIIHSGNPGKTILLLLFVLILLFIINFFFLNWAFYRNREQYAAFQIKSSEPLLSIRSFPLIGKELLAMKRLKFFKQLFVSGFGILSVIFISAFGQEKTSTIILYFPLISIIFILYLPYVAFLERRAFRAYYILPVKISNIILIKDILYLLLTGLFFLYAILWMVIIRHEGWSFKIFISQFGAFTLCLMFFVLLKNMVGFQYPARLSDTSFFELYRKVHPVYKYMILGLIFLEIGLFTLVKTYFFIFQIIVSILLLISVVIYFRQLDKISNQLYDNRNDLMEFFE